MIDKNNFLAVVVLFWNDSDKTIKCLDSLLNQKKQKLNIVLVDNNSKEKFVREINKFLRKKKIKIIKINEKNKISKKIKSKNYIFYLKNKINYGCGLGHNSGYNFSINNNYKYIARIDNDMIAPPELMFNLIKRLEKNKYLIALSPKVMFENERKRIWFGGAKIGKNLKFQKQCSNEICGQIDSKQYKGLIDTDAIVGCASIMRKKNLQKAGLSDPEFFYGEEDIELSNRLKNTSGKIAVDLDQKIYHSVSHTVGSNWAKNIYYNYKYRLVLLKKIGTWSDKLMGYSSFIIKFIFTIFFSFNSKYSSKLVPILFAGLHYLQKKYGNYDRKNYLKINNFFKNFDKKTSLLKLFKILSKKT
jgi:GT2 family glycosyltransferase